MRYILLVFSLLLLHGCALLEGQSWHPPLPLVLPPDSTGQAITVIYAKNFLAGNYKDRGDHRAQGGGTFVAKANAPVATGQGQAQDFGKAGQHGGAVATAPGATSGATTRTGIPPWALVVGAFVVLLLLVASVVLYYRRKLLRVV